MDIYVITNQLNGKEYVGQTREGIEKRWRRHIGYNLRDNDTKLYRAMRKYGVDNFKIVKIDEAKTQKELDQKEKFWIEKLNTIEEGYNIARGALGGDTLSKHPDLNNIKKKISKAHRGEGNPNATSIICIDHKLKYSKIYPTMKSCQQELGIKHHSTIGRRCRGITKKRYKDRYDFKYWKV